MTQATQEALYFSDDWAAQREQFPEAVAGLHGLLEVRNIDSNGTLPNKQRFDVLRLLGVYEQGVKNNTIIRPYTLHEQEVVDWIDASLASTTTYSGIPEVYHGMGSTGYIMYSDSNGKRRATIDVIG